MLTILSVLSCIYWLAVAWATERTLRGVPTLDAPSPTRANWPMVSVVIPARDEADYIESALRSKLADSYPNLEVVFVDDRSVDATRSIANAISSQDPRLRVVAVEHLPAGWLGKVHAMHQGLEHARGEWILFSDADVALVPGTLQSVIAYAERVSAGHVTALPRITAKGALLVPTIAAFFRVIIVGARLWKVPQPNSKAAAGVGAFNLVHRTALAQTPGLQWLKMEVADDMGLGLMLKQSGVSSLVLNGRDHIRLDFYPSYRAMVRSVEKNGASVPLPSLCLGLALLVTLEGGFLLGPWWLALMTGLIAMLACARLARWLRQPLWASVVPVVGILLFASAMVRSGILATYRGGAIWRDTFYSTREIRTGARVKISR